MNYIKRIALICIIIVFALVPSFAQKIQQVDFGPNVIVFDPSMSAETIQKQINRVYNSQRFAQFGNERYALLFKPGTYAVDIPVGFYTEVMGLGASPDEVKITGNLHSDAYLSGNNSTCNFWRGVTNFSVVPSDKFVQWAVSQATWFRQMHIEGNMVLHQHSGWASGGWMANTRVEGTVGSGPQQQWISRNTEWAKWTGSNWNMVFVGVVNPPAGNWPNPPYTRIPVVPVIREKPYLQVNKAGEYSVRLPSIKKDSAGYDWAEGSVPGNTLPISKFYIARSDTDTADTLNTQLSKGMNILLTPGIYGLTNTIHVTRPDTVILGMGLATLRVDTSNAGMKIGDIDGVTVSGVLFDAGNADPPVLMEVGTNNIARHTGNPIVLHDVIFRVGGSGIGKAQVSLRINANDTIVDHTWIWRADHGSRVGWMYNRAARGLVVNGNNVTIYGLFVEHYQEYQVFWYGDGGRTYFYQSELPYDPPDQGSWTAGFGVRGWASYKVDDGVTSHEAWGMGIYSVFKKGDIFLSNAVEAPRTPKVRFHHIITVCIGANGGIMNVINGIGGKTAINCSGNPKITDYPE